MSVLLMTCQITCLFSSVYHVHFVSNSSSTSLWRIKDFQRWNDEPMGGTNSKTRGK